MGKVTKKIWVIIISVILLVTSAFSVVGCGKIDEEEIVDAGKTQLYVGSWDGGLGTKWLTLIAEKFEEASKDISFEDGKKGVQVHVNPSGVYALDTQLGSIKDASDDIIVNEQMNYYGLIGNGSAMDISDIITTPLTEYGETKSIKDKMYADDVAFYGQNKDEFYGVPWYSSIFGINYDVDLFEDNFYYFSDEPSQDDPDDPFVSPDNVKRSAGPDGKYCEICAGNNYNYSDHIDCDDGLPATFEEFFVLCDKMYEDSVIPMIWAGNQKGYVDQWMCSFADSIDGYENAILNYTLDGNADTIVKFDSNGNPIKNGNVFTFENPIKIDNSNGYLLKRQAGKYYALEFLGKLLNTKIDGKVKYVDGNIITRDTHKSTQDKFLLSRFTDGEKPVAMLAEGSWWYNEASPTFDSMKSISGTGKTERRIGIMPFPKPYADYQADSTPSFTNTWITSIILRKNMPTERVEAAKAFFRFMHTDEMLTLFVNETHCMRPFEFDMSETAKENASFHLLQQYEYFNGGKYKVVNAWSANEIVINNLTSFCGTQLSSVANNAIDGLKDNLNSPLNYFKGYYELFTQEKWNSDYSKYLNK